ncbi:MAG: right-handed parallel beta-helix repeat-containing protein [Gemmatimonadales bacterium]
MVRLAVLIAAAGLIALAAAGNGRTASPSSPAIAVETQDNAFAPEVLRVAPGSTIVWHNLGRNAHSVTADDRAWNSGLVDPGRTFRRTFPRPGTYRYFCVPHGGRDGRGMAGVILVGDASLLAVPRPAPAAGAPRTLTVPGGFPTIQAAVRAARPGDLILIAPGLYREAVVVTTPGITLRGRDRDRVILDGRFTRANGVKVLGADGVVIENMTARHYTANGFFWTGVRGYRGSYLTAYNNGEYGLYAFDSAFGQFDHSYASGHPDSGFYIGQCKPCHALITHALAEGNALGYSGTNAGGDLTIRDSIWRANLAGIVPNTLDSERLAPQDGVRIVRNLVYGNHNRRAPAEMLQYPSFGNGIIVAGGINNLVEGNLVWDHPNYGILVIANLSKQLWLPSGNVVRHNAVWASGHADLALAAPAGAGNCFRGGRHQRSTPPGIQGLYGCGSPLKWIGGGDPGAFLLMYAQYRVARSGRIVSPNWRNYPAPPPQPGMSDPLAPPRPAWPTAESGQVLPAARSAPPAPPSEAYAFAPRFPAAPRAGVEMARLVLYVTPPAAIVGVGVYLLYRVRRRRRRTTPQVEW